MLFRSFAGAAAVVRSASVIRQSPTLTKLARAIPIRPSPIVLAQRSLAHVTLDHLAPAPGKKKRRIVGRGRGSKRGGHTSGRGHNGAKARGTGNPYVGFEGGQTPLYKKIPKRGFNNNFRKVYRPLNISTVQKWIQQGRYDPSETLTINKAQSTGMINFLSPTKYNGVKLTGHVDPSLPIPAMTVHLSRFSESAAQKILEAGGSCLSVYHNRLAFWQELHPDKFEGARRVKMAGPTKRRDIEFYTNPDKYGYLADPEVKDAFFRSRGWNPEIRRSRFDGKIRTDVPQPEGVLPRA